ncbi:MAG: ATP-binding protein [Treponema sp.]|nr:ATP-binding protein [Treponema sp.]
MLLGYGARNIWSFKDWMQVDLSLNGLVPSDVSMNLPAATAMCFKGANASGKTNGIKVLAFIVDFLTNSFAYKPKTPIYFDSYFLNTQPSELYLQFLCDDKEYLYEAELTKDKVLSEKLTVNNELVFQRVSNKIEKNFLYDGHKEITFRDNASFLSTLNQYEIPEIERVYQYLSLIVLNVGYKGHNSIDYYDYHGVARRYYELPEIFDSVKKTIRMYDTGVDNITIENKTDEAGNIFYYPLFIHENNEGQKIPLLFEMESKGTQTLFRILLNFFITLHNGSLLVLDEMDEYLDPEILPHLLNLYITEKNNPKHAQLICTVHTPDVMDVSGKYRTYIFKKIKNESICYRLDELKKLRNDRSIVKEFKKHLIGGYPEIGQAEQKQ